MLFNSYIFILFFLPATMILYFCLRKFELHIAAKVSLILMSLWFYGYFNYKYLYIMVGSILFNYVFSKLILKNINTKWGKTFRNTGVIANIMLLFVFKYYNFFVQNIATVFQKDFFLIKLVLPLGISFFTFQQIAYLIDSYRGETKEYIVLRLDFLRKLLLQIRLD